jgi:prevent-host-death family protein
MVMKRMSIQDLKGQLSAAVAEAEAGGFVEITRHNRPVAVLAPAESPHVHRGRRVGAGSLKPVLKRATRGRYLAVLSDDRANR